MVYNNSLATRQRSKKKLKYEQLLIELKQSNYDTLRGQLCKGQHGDSFKHLQQDIYQIL